MEKILQKNRIKTYCVHCEKEFKNVWICEMNSIIGTRYALLCTGCQKLMGIYYSKDFIEPVISPNINFDELPNSLN
jgi:hypothetical protein